MTETNTTAPFLSQKAYDALKFMALIFLPAVGSLYFSLAGLWNLPHAEQIVGTITVIDAFIGVIIGISAKTYNNSNAGLDGHISIIHDPSTNKKLYSLELDYDPEGLIGKDRVTFRVGEVQDR